MLQIPVCPDPETGEERTLRYDEHGYSLVTSQRIVFTYRLEAVCYLLGRQDRERLALIHGLLDVGEHRMAEWVARQKNCDPLH